MDYDLIGSRGGFWCRVMIGPGWFSCVQFGCKNSCDWGWFHVNDAGKDFTLKNWFCIGHAPEDEKSRLFDIMMRS